MKTAFALLLLLTPSLALANRAAFWAQETLSNDLDKAMYAADQLMCSPDSYLYADSIEALGKRLPTRANWLWQKYAVNIDHLALKIGSHEGIARVLRGKIHADIRHVLTREGEETVLFVAQSLFAIAKNHPLTIPTLVKLSEAARERRLSNLVFAVEGELKKLLAELWDAGDDATRSDLTKDERCATRLRRVRSIP